MASYEITWRIVTDAPDHEAAADLAWKWLREQADDPLAGVLLVVVDREGGDRFTTVRRRADDRAGGS